MYRPVFEFDWGFLDEEFNFESAIDYIMKNEVAFKLPEQKVRRIKDDVEKTIAFLADQIGSINKRFMPQAILKVGSFYEGTKILEPNEFDFLIVIEDLSIPGKLKVDTIENTGYVKVTIRDETMQETWKEFLQGDILLNLMEYNNTSAQNEPISYSDVLFSVLERLATEQSLTFENYHGDFFCDAGIRIGKGGENNAKIKQAFVRCPNIEIKLDYEGLEIGVDMSPAIKFYNIGEVLSPEQCLHPSLYREIEKRGNCLLVNGWYNQQSDAFRITFTESEVSLVQKMSDQHRNVYKLFKLMHALTMELIDRRDWSDISSFLMKTSCLLHDLDAGGQEHSTEECIGRILNYLFVSLNIQHLPGLFNRDQDLLKLDYDKKRRMKTILGELKIFSYIFQKLYSLQCETPSVRSIVQNLVDKVKMDSQEACEVIYDTCKFLREKNKQTKG